mmetsp:Transcript_57877/g.111631  ORF Transcript_57877/g.111631 Transcript_57877/m.111631 type:complete len:81 (-) Transcript_57877:473-715(-)
MEFHKFDKTAANAAMERPAKQLGSFESKDLEFGFCAKVVADIAPNNFEDLRQMMRRGLPLFSTIVRTAWRERSNEVTQRI